MDIQIDLSFISSCYLLCQGVRGNDGPHGPKGNLVSKSDYSDITLDAHSRTV